MSRLTQKYVMYNADVYLATKKLCENVERDVSQDVGVCVMLGRRVVSRCT